MARLKLFTSKNCPKCPAAKDLVAKVAKELKINEHSDYEIINIDEGENLISALKYQIASTPSFVIDEEAVFIGTVPSKNELIKKLRIYE
jgi:thiol-disulfide isomerase/thioredoxin